MAGIFLGGKINYCWVLDESLFNMWEKFSFYSSFYNSSSCVDTYINIWERKNKLYLYWLVRGNSTRLQSSSSPFWGESGRMFYRVKKRWIEICPWLCLQQANGQRVGQWATSNGQWATGTWSGQSGVPSQRLLIGRQVPSLQVSEEEGEQLD